MKNDNDWIEYLRKEEADFLPDAPEGLWEDIEQSLPIKGKRPARVVPMWLRYGGVAASIALLFGVGSLFVSSPEDEEDCPPAIAKTKYVIGKKDILEKAEKIVATAKPVLSQHEEMPLAQLAENVGTTTSVIEETPGEPTAHSEKKGETAPPKKKRSSDLWLAQSSEIPTSHSRKRVSISLHAGNIMASNTSSQSNFLTSESFPPDNDTEDNPYGDIFDLNEGAEMETKKHYRQPLRAGIRVAIPITDRIDIESGLTYTLLSSLTESGSQENYYRTEQTLHYIGVPLKLRYQLWQGKRISIYASGGSMVEKCVSGNAETKFIIGGNINATERQTVKERPLQFSATLSAGIEAQITQNVSLFAEPGASYYIDNHSPIDNIYKDKPLNFDLSLGVRINLNK